MKTLLTFLVLVLLGANIEAQTNLQVQFTGTGAPTGYCSTALYTVRETGLICSCDNTTHTWGTCTAPSSGVAWGGLTGTLSSQTDLNNALNGKALSDLSNVSGSVSVSNFPATQPVSGVFWQVTQPVSLLSLPLPTNAATDRTTAVAPFSFRLTDGTSFYKPTTPSDTQPVSGTFWQTTQPISAVNLDVALSTRLKPTDTLNAIGSINNALPAGSNTLGSASLGNSTGKTVTMKTGSLTTTATTADQVVLTYTVTAGKIFYLQAFDVVARLTTYASTATNFGDCSLESPTGTKLYTNMVAHAGSPVPISVLFAEPIPIAASTVIRLVCTPSTTTSFLWRGNFSGFER